MKNIDYMQCGEISHNLTAISQTLGTYFSLLNKIKNDDKMYNYILSLGNGHYFSGHLRYIEEGNSLKYKFGELIVILEEVGVKPRVLFKGDKVFKRIYQKAFSTQEEIVNFSLMASMKKYLSILVEKAEEYGLLEKYDLKKYYIIKDMYVYTTTKNNK